MTQALGPVKQTYILPIGGGGVAVPWRYLSAMGHEAEYQNAANTPLQALTFGVDYRILPEGDVAANAGTLTLLTAPPVGATKLVLWRRTPKIQNYDATPGAEGIEAQLDRLTLAMQETVEAGSTAPGGETQRYLGGLSADPVTDLQGNPLIVGVTYWNSTLNAMRVWNGTVWATVSGSGAQAASALLSAFAALTIIANKGIYGTGAGTLGTFDLTTFGRQLAGAVDGPAARLLLSIGDVALADLLPLSLIDPAMIITDVETLAANKLASAVPTAKAVTDYVDPLTAATVRAWANFSGVPLSGTYTRSGTLVTVTMTAHGMATGQRGQFDFTTGAATDGTYAVTVIDANTFTLVDAASGATSGNVTRLIFIRASHNVATIVRLATGDYLITFASALPDAFFAAVVSAPSISNGTAFVSAALNLATPQSTTQVRVAMLPTGAGGGGSVDTSVFSLVVVR